MESGRRVPNRVLLALMLAGLLAWLALDAVSLAPNRIVPGNSYRAFEIGGGWPALAMTLPMLVVAGLAWRPSPQTLRLALWSVLALLVLLPWWLVAASASLVEPEMPQARIGIGVSIWLLLFVWLLTLIELRTRLGLPRQLGWLLLLPVLASWWVALVWWLEPLSLYREYQARSDQFLAAVTTHLALVGAAVLASLVLGALLALAMRRHPGVRRAGFGLLNFLQTVPSLALFGLLLAPLAWLGARFDALAAIGVSGIGWAPAFLALLGYSLLPMVRNMYVALEEVDPAVIESAHGMGMNRRQVLLQVRLPLALPIVLEGIRITTVQAIGLTAVAALIGAGGLGTFVFQGLGQAAMDMVLLGALPILGLALVADAAISALSERLRPGGAA
ncbi:ABC transporter permease [Billgrantia saliphila]|uniref:ABC transporter permease n=1 Tax=Billgrantia saliphila TaxID=1848458 RepID=UPI000CE571F0|nr:ABC transporter permease [Halomonas saliphila]